ncbi:type IIL restriction-modification enzyme MmeI, partial [Corynebacterium sanguinis]|uniref:type IIL restriction-modification enzyme MmeI n=1 Tax=Corynebacterium sanguinis TaxID=2594913 RepID=UPI001C95B964
TGYRQPPTPRYPIPPYRYRKETPVKWAYPALFEAHRALDEAVERAYNLEPGCGEPEIITKLYALYDDELAREKLKKRSKKK